VDATILVATAEQTTRRNVRRTLELLRQVGAPLIGVVLNRVSEQEQYGYPRYGAYAYAPRQYRTDAGNVAVTQEVSSSERRR
jgi:polysaccharide biosynthesis transport protein